MHNASGSGGSEGLRTTHVAHMPAASSPSYAPASVNTNPLFEIESLGAGRDGASHASYSLSTVSSSEAPLRPASAGREGAGAAPLATSAHAGSHSDYDSCGGTPHADPRLGSEADEHWWDADGLTDSCSCGSPSPGSPQSPEQHQDAPYPQQGSQGPFNREDIRPFGDGELRMVDLGPGGAPSDGRPAGASQREPVHLTGGVVEASRTAVQW